MQTKLLIDGELVAGEGPVERILDPASGLSIAEVREASSSQMNAAVAAAEAAAPAWAQTTPKDRAALLLRLADRIEADGAAYAKLESDNTGKPLTAALNDEIPAIADVFRFFAGAARVQHGALAGEYLPGYTSMIRRDPVGVVASIAPWNYPLMMAAWKLGPALAAGNTVILKPSEQTPLTALKLAEALAELFPKGVVNIICGRGETVGALLVSHPRVRMVSLTGDVSPGQKILSAAAGNLKRTHLELGGKAPVIVFGRTDLRLLQRRPGLHRSVPRLRRRQDLRQAGGRSQRRRTLIESRTADRGRRGNGTAHFRRAADPRSGIRRTRGGNPARGNHHGRKSPRRRGVFLRADARGRHPAIG